MTQKREEMLDRVIHRYGFEDRRTIEVARACETYAEGAIGDAIIEAMIEGCFEEELDDEEDEE